MTSHLTDEHYSEQSEPPERPKMRVGTGGFRLPSLPSLSRHTKERLKRIGTSLFTGLIVALIFFGFIFVKYRIDLHQAEQKRAEIESAEKLAAKVMYEKAWSDAQAQYRRQLIDRKLGRYIIADKYSGRTVFEYLDLTCPDCEKVVCKMTIDGPPAPPGFKTVGNSIIPDPEYTRNEVSNVRKKVR